MSIFKRVAKSAGSVIKSADLFPAKIGFTYKGDTAYKTYFGGIATLGVYFLMLWYSIGLLTNMARRKDFTLRQATSEEIEVGDEAKVLNFTSSKVRLAYVWHDPLDTSNPYSTMDEKYGVVEPYTYSLEQTATGGYVDNWVYLPVTQ